MRNNITCIIKSSKNIWHIKYNEMNVTASLEVLTMAHTLTAPSPYTVFTRKLFASVLYRLILENT